MSLDVTFLEVPTLRDGELELILAVKDPGDPARKLVPAYKFDLRVGDSNARAGGISLRLGTTQALTQVAGQVGYGVEPAFRGHRFALRACRLILPLARAHGFEELFITCSPDNLASRRTCELLGAELLGIGPVPPGTDMYLHGERQVCRYRLAL
jgi:tagatose 1,6-diphosphate aldolase